MFDGVLSLTALARTAIELSGIAFANKQVKSQKPNNAYDASRLYYDSLEADNSVNSWMTCPTVKDESPSQKMHR